LACIRQLGIQARGGRPCRQYHQPQRACFVFYQVRLGLERQRRRSRRLAILQSSETPRRYHKYTGAGGHGQFCTERVHQWVWTLTAKSKTENTSTVTTKTIKTPDETSSVCFLPSSELIRVARATSAPRRARAPVMVCMMNSGG